MKILLAVPHKGLILTQLANYVGRAKLKIREKGHEVIMIYNDNVPLDLARNQIVEFAKKNNVDKLFFLDADITSSKSEDVLKLCLSDKEVIAGIYPKRSFPIKHISKIDGKPLTDFPKDELFEVTTTGAGFMCIDTNIFKRMTKPYFHFDLTKGIDSPGEDEWFCNKVKSEAKTSVWIDPSVKCLHYGWHGFSFE